MTQLAIVLDDDTANDLAEASRKAGISPEIWVERVVRAQLKNRLPDSFFAVLGTWEDDREPEEILRDIRYEAPEKKRAALR
jgi:hypothetical protein